MKQSVRVLFVLCLSVSIFVFSGCNIVPNDKTVILGSALWPNYTFEEAIAEAETIVYGKAVSKSGIMEHEISLNPERSDKEYYCEVYLEPIELLKGEENEDGTVTVLDFEVETDTHVYHTEGVEPVILGQEYIFFMNEHGSFLTPQMMIPVESGTVETNFLPEIGNADNSEVKRNAKQSGKLSVEKYLSAIEEAM